MKETTSVNNFINFVKNSINIDVANTSQQINPIDIQYLRLIVERVKLSDNDYEYAQKQFSESVVCTVYNLPTPNYNNDTLIHQIVNNIYQYDTINKLLAQTN
jgi:hypothetical protein